MAQITTTNRQAILELIAQADETVEVNGLSASVTQLQIDVAGLSASIAGMTGGGGSCSCPDIVVSGGVATFSATSSVVSEVKNGLTYSRVNVEANKITQTSVVGDITDTLLLSPDSNIDNSKFRSEDTNTGAYSQLVMTYDNPSFETINGLDSVSLTLSAGSAVISTGDGIGTQSTIDIQAAGITSTSTDGVNTTTESISPTAYSITTPTTLYSAQQSGDLELRADGNLTLYGDYQGNQNNIAIQSNQIVSTVGDGTNTATETITNTSIDLNITDGSEQHSITINSATNRITLFTNDGSSPNYQSELRVSTEGGGASINIGSQNITSGQIATHNLTEVSIISTVNNGAGGESLVEVSDNYISVARQDGTGTQSTTTTYASEVLIQSTNGVDTSSISVQPTFIALTGLQSFDDDAAAGTGGLTTGMIYQTTGNGANPLDVAGILMIKQ